jgi:hypothetical protein
MKIKTGHVSRISKEPSHLYLMGWIVAAEVSGSEWGIDSHGQSENRWSDDPSKHTKVHSTKELALGAARKYKQENPREKVYVRSYAYETSNKENAVRFCVSPLTEYTYEKENV